MCLFYKSTESEMDKMNYTLRLKKSLYNYYKYILRREQPLQLKEEYDILRLQRLINQNLTITEMALLKYEFI
jgi:hypothetical protein